MACTELLWWHFVKSMQVIWWSGSPWWNLQSPWLQWLEWMIGCQISSPSNGQQVGITLNQWGHGMASSQPSVPSHSSKAFIHQGIRPLATKSPEISKPLDSGLDFSNHLEISQVFQHQCFWGPCQISEQYDNFNTWICGFESLRNLTKWRLTA